MKGEIAGEKWDSAIVVALGGNLGLPPYTPAEVVEAALAALGQNGFKIIRRSSAWRSKAWPDPTAPAYLNAVAIVETPLDARETLARLHGIETAFGRVRNQPNAARTLDLDLIAHGRQVRAAAPVLPHPRAAERLFVMGPLAEIAPDWRHPQNGRTAADLARNATVGCDAAPILLSSSAQRGRGTP